MRRLIIPTILTVLFFLHGACGRTPTEPTIPTGVPAQPTAVTQLTAVTQPTATATPRPATPAPESIIPAPQDPATQQEQIPALATRTAAFAAVARNPVPVLPLPPDALDANQAKAQEIALAAPEFTAYTYTPTDDTPLRNEIFSVQPLRPSDITAATQPCAGRTNCYRVELYNYALNITSNAVVDVEAGRVLDVAHMESVQPELPPALAELAQEIALNAPETTKELGFTPAALDMPNVKTALNNSACQDAKHLCVAPTFIMGDRALWAIVDLTDNQLVGLRWTALGDFSAGRPTQELVALEEIFENYCNTLNQLSRSGWQLDYILTGSDGLRISDVTFQGRAVLDSVKVVDFHVSYSFREGFGYSDAVGCPAFSSSAVVASSPPQIEDILLDGLPVGFALTQDYRHTLWPAPCNYRYAQRYEFYDDGAFRTVVTNLGRGCGNQGTYRPIIRIDPAGTAQQVAEWDGSAWQPQETEQWIAQADAPKSDEGYLLRLDGDGSTPYYLEPSGGQFPGERGDNALVYITRHHSEEGDADLATLGTCCANDFRQGPYQFINGEPLGGDTVIWYVPQIENDDGPGQEYCWADVTVQDGLFVPQVWPCSAGPRFVPVR